MNWKAIVGSVAPTLATALGGPLAGMATKAIAGAVLGNENAREYEIENAIVNGGPETLLKLRQAEQEFAVKMRELDVDIEKLHQQDRQSARDRAAKMNDWTPMALGAVIVGFWGFMNYTLLTMAPPPAIDGEIVGRILGMIDAATLAVIYYVYGSSAGSKAKSDAMEGRK